VLAGSTRLTDAVGRLGGDEFGVLLTQCDREAGERIAGRLAATIAANPIDFGNRSITITATAGVADTASAGNAEAALEQADQAMYAARRKALRR
jgi:diguanylate cyclase (GGDEF)-like protein